MTSVQYFVMPRSATSSPDHNGNASTLDKMPPLPPWLTRTKDLQQSPPQNLSQEEPKDLSPRSRHFSSGSNGKSFSSFSNFFHISY